MLLKRRGRSYLHGHEGGSTGEQLVAELWLVLLEAITLVDLLVLVS